MPASGMNLSVNFRDDSAASVTLSSLARTAALVVSMGNRLPPAYLRRVFRDGRELLVFRCLVWVWVRTGCPKFFIFFHAPFE